ncbi:MAG TPA: DNA repair protein RecO [Gemmatimonadales bacterium]
MAAAAELTPAIVLGAIRYGETSRIVRLATREFGVVSAIAKGALRPKSRFGASLQLLSEGHAHLIASRSSDLHTLAAFDLADAHRGLAKDLNRYGAANALAEVAGRFVAPMANAVLFDQFRRDLALIELAPPEAVAVVGIRGLWRLVEQLGFGLTVAVCARDGAPLAPGAISLSLRDGGLLCPACGRDGATNRLSEGDRAGLEALAAGLGELPVLTRPQAAAHRRLLWRWVREHLGDGPMPALDAWKESPAA